MVLLLILLILCLAFGVFGTGRSWGYYGWSPLGILLVVFLVLLLTGSLR